MALEWDLSWCVLLAVSIPIIQQNLWSFKASLWLESQQAECLKCIWRCKHWELHEKHVVSCWVVLSALAGWSDSLNFSGNLLLPQTERKQLMPKSPAHSAGKCSVCFCRAGMCSVAQQCTLAFAGMLKGAALPESWFQCSFRCFFHPFLWSCCHSSMFVYDQLGSNETNTAAQLIPAVCGVSCSDKRLKKPL